MKYVITIALTLAMTACSTPPNPVKVIGETKVVDDVTRAPAAKDVNSVTDDPTFGEAMLSPLEDINLRKVEIPKLLEDMDDPYAPVIEQTCQGVLSEIVELNTVLGPDMDAEDHESAKSRKSRKRKETSLDLVGAAASSFIPFRGLVRTATGATSYEKELRVQYRKGVARRAYLRGIYDEKGC